MNPRHAVFIAVVLANTVFYSGACAITVQTNQAIPSRLNIYDKILYKKVTLHGPDRRIFLVNRITGEVKYIFADDEWVLLSGRSKKECQLKYDAQRRAIKENKDKKIN